MRSKRTSEGRVGTEASGEDLAVVGEEILGHTVAAHGLGEGVADGPGGGPDDHLGGGAEPGVVVESRDDRRLAAALELHAAHDVHLPELHGPGALPALVVASLSAALRGLE